MQQIRLIQTPLETYDRVQEKVNIIRKLEKDLVNYEKQKLTVVHQKETIDRNERYIIVFKTQTSKFIDNLLERQDTSKSNRRVDPPPQLFISDSTFASRIAYL